MLVPQMNERLESEKGSLFFVNSLFGGGAERVCCDLIHESMHRMPTSVVVLNGAGITTDIVRGCRVLDLEIPNYASPGKRMAAMLRRRKLVNRFIGDIESYQLSSAHLNASHVLARMSSISNKTLYAVHGSQDLSRFSKRAFYGWLLKGFFSGREVVCVSEGIRDELVGRFGLRPDSCEVINNPICIELVRKKAKCETDGIPRRPYFLAVGRLEKAKRFDRLLRIFEAGRYYETYDLVILGCGGEEGALKELASDLGIGEAVHFPGHVDNPYVWMSHAQIQLCTSDAEAFPVCLVEGLACGARVVASDCDYGPREIMTGLLADFLVPPSNLSAYIEAIDRALSEYPSAESILSAQLSAGGALDAFLGRWRRVYG